MSMGGRELARNRTSGLKGAVARSAGRNMMDKAASMNDKKNAMASASGITGENHASKPTSMLANMKRDQGMKNLKRENGLPGMAKRAALAANERALANGAPLPYKTDKMGNLTPSAMRAAKHDMRAMTRGDFTKNPEFGAFTKNPTLDAKKMADARASLMPQFTDENGNVNKSALEAAARRSVDADNKGTLARREVIGNSLLSADQSKAPQDRQYLDANGKLSMDGQRALLTDIAALDNNQVNQADALKAQELYAADQDKYDSMSSATNPNAGLNAALRDAHQENFGTNGLYNKNPRMLDEAQNAAKFQSQGAPVINKDISAGEASKVAGAMGGSVSGLSPETGEALGKYSTLLTDPNTSPDAIQGAYDDALGAATNANGMTEESQAVRDHLLAPLGQGMHVTPEAARTVAADLPDSSVALKNAVSGYADAVEAHGADSREAGMALSHMQKAVSFEDGMAKANIVGTLPRPESAMANQMQATFVPGMDTPVSTMAPSLVEARQVAPETMAASYASDVRNSYGLSPAESVSLPEGQMFSSFEMAQFENNPEAQAAIQETRQAQRAAMGLAPDSADWSAPLLSPAESRGITQAQSLGVVMDDNVPTTTSYATMTSAPTQMVEGLTSASGGSPVEGAPQMAVANEAALAYAVSSRGDGSQYVNGMVVNPVSPRADLERAVETLPEGHQARTAMASYQEAMVSHSEAPERVIEARNDVLSSLGMPTPAQAPDFRQEEVQAARNEYETVLSDRGASPAAIREAEQAYYTASAPVSDAPYSAPMSGVIGSEHIQGMDRQAPVEPERTPDMFGPATPPPMPTQAPEGYRESDAYAFRAQRGETLPPPIFETVAQAREDEYGARLVEAQTLEDRTDRPSVERREELQQEMSVLSQSMGYDHEVPVEDRARIENEYLTRNLNQYESYSRTDEGHADPYVAQRLSQLRSSWLASQGQYSGHAAPEPRTERVVERVEYASSQAPTPTPAPAPAPAPEPEPETAQQEEAPALYDEYSEPQEAERYMGDDEPHFEDVSRLRQEIQAERSALAQINADRERLRQAKETRSSRRALAKLDNAARKHERRIEALMARLSGE